MKQLSEKRAFNKLAKQLKRERKNAKPAPHFSNTSNPVDFPKMTTYKHIVQVHPVELGEPNLVKVVREIEFAGPTGKETAERYIELYNENPQLDRHGYPTQAVYHGRVNDITGELE